MSLLYGEGILDLSTDISGASDTAAFAIWRHLGALGKVHNSYLSRCGDGVVKSKVGSDGTLRHTYCFVRLSRGC